MIISTGIPLGNDEVYYLLYGRFFNIHFFDHPIMIGAFLKINFALLPFKNIFIYRLPFILVSLVSVYIVFKIGSLLANPLAGWYSAFLYSTTFYSLVISGCFIMPDNLMSFFWILSIYFASNFLFNSSSGKKLNQRWLILFGISTGLAMASKIHSFIMWPSMLLYLFIYHRKYFLKYSLWLSFTLSFLAWIPMFIWNYKNNWVHFSFYRSRVGIEDSIHFDYIFRELIGEILYQNPIIWFLIIFWISRSLPKIVQQPPKVFLLFFSVPMLIFIWSVSFFKETLPHWTGPGYFSLIILASINMSESFSNKNTINRIFIINSIFVFLITIFSILLIRFYPGTIGKKETYRTYGQNDFTLDMYGWEKSGRSIARKIQIYGYDRIPIYIDNWFPAAHFDEYISPYLKSNVYGVNELQRIHHYYWINSARNGVPNSDSALFISSSNYPANPKVIYNGYFNKIICFDSVPEYRSGQLTRYFHLFLMTKKAN